jgi:hypothetical protein
MQNRQDENSETCEIRITGVSKKLRDELLGISKHHSVSMPDFLKPKIREIVDSYPDRIRKPIE